MIIKKNGVSVNLTESDLNRITKKVLKESVPSNEDLVKRIESLEKEVNKIKSSLGKKV